MGSLCSRPSTTYGGGQVLGSGPGSSKGSNTRPLLGSQAPAPGRQGQGRITVSSGGQSRGYGSAGDADRRAALAEAAERRMQAENARGTQASNPNQGRLAAKLEASKKTAVHREEEMPERLIYE